jgi:hypothetical protein
MVLAGGKPGANFLAQRVCEAAVRHVDQTAQCGAAVADAAVGRDAEGAKAGSSPVDADHGLSPFGQLR